MQVVRRQLDGVFVAVGQRVEVLPLKLRLHRVHVQTEQRAGRQPERVPVALNLHGRAEKLPAALLGAEHPRGERAAAGGVAHGGGQRVLVARNHVDRRVRLQLAQHLDQRIERLRVSP